MFFPCFVCFWVNLPELHEISILEKWTLGLHTFKVSSAWWKIYTSFISALREISCILVAYPAHDALSFVCMGCFCSSWGYLLFVWFSIVILLWVGTTAPILRVGIGGILNASVVGLFVVLLWLLAVLWWWRVWTIWRWAGDPVVWLCPGCRLCLVVLDVVVEGLLSSKFKESLLELTPANFLNVFFVWQKFFLLGFFCWCVVGWLAYQEKNWSGQLICNRQ